MPSATKTSGTETIIELPLDQLDLDDKTFQFRLKLRVKDLVEDLKARGQDFPIVVRKVGNKKKLQIVCGFRRVTALQELEAKTVKAVVRTLDDDAAYRLSWAENQQRKTYSDLDRANAILKGQAAGKTTKELETLFGLEERQLRRLRTLVDMPKAIKEALGEGKITAAHAFVLKDAQKLIPNLKHNHWIAKVVEEELSATQLKRRITKEEAPKKARRSWYTQGDDGKLKVRSFTLDPTKMDEEDWESVFELANLLADVYGKAKETADIDVRSEPASKS